MQSDKTVLLVDDDRDLVLGASLRLRARGFKTITAHDGREGVSTARQEHPDAIVLDVRMPEMNGLKALERLQQDPQTVMIPVVMLSASLVDQQAALDAGAKFFIKKPYQPNHLVCAVERALVDAESNSAS